MISVGIPRSLLYYKYFPLWHTFFENLDVEVITSPLTNRKILDEGAKNIVDEACLPLKVYFGHVNYLKDKVDYIFAPRIVSVEKKEFTCPKFMGIPDMLVSNMEKLPPIIGPTIDLTKQDKNLWKQIWEVGTLLDKNPLQVTWAWQKGIRELKKYNYQWQKREIPPELNITSQNIKKGTLNIAVLGHEYILYDPYISMNLLEKLGKLNIKVYTIEMLPQNILNSETKDFPKRLFWNFAKNSLGTAFYFNKNPQIDGFILISSFGCGPDSMISSMISHNLKGDTNKPILNLTIDEHTGEAGLNTRIEAFYDLLTRRVG